MFSKGVKGVKNVLRLLKLNLPQILSKYQTEPKILGYTNKKGKSVPQCSSTRAGPK